MQLDYNTRRNLEILETLKDRRKKGALVSVIDKTKTAMGARLLKKFIIKPLFDKTEINSRLDMVEVLSNNYLARQELLLLLDD